MRQMIVILSAMLIATSCSAQDEQPWEDSAERAGPQEGRQGGGGQGGHRGSPPPEAFTACEEKSENDACSVETPRGTLEGTCLAQDSDLFCAPEGGPPPR